MHSKETRTTLAHPPHDAHVTYQQQYRKCGAPYCKTCRLRRGHGPYWYGYWRDDAKKLHSFYIGKEAPGEVQHA